VTDSVFVSYSRDDSRMATLVVQLLRARDDVFYDIDSIKAGEPWRDALLRAIDDATHFYLLWCMHSARSEEVEWEWRRAISGNKRLVPVLLDSTPLVEPLTKYQWVDFQGVVEGHKPAILLPGVLRSRRDLERAKARQRAIERRAIEQLAAAIAQDLAIHGRGR
jgi:hypothetical protein